MDTARYPRQGAGMTVVGARGAVGGGGWLLGQAADDVAEREECSAEADAHEEDGDEEL